MYAGKPRIYDDGTLVYPARGYAPPPVPQGYKQSPGNPFILIPDLSTVPCKFRQEVEMPKANCSKCGTYTTYGCQKGKRVSLKTCTECHYRLVKD